MLQFKVIEAYVSYNDDIWVEMMSLHLVIDTSSRFTINLANISR